MNLSIEETGIKTIPMEKKWQKAKWLSGEALEIAVKRREAKSKGEKEKYKHLNAEFQRIARRDKKAFFSDQFDLVPVCSLVLPPCHFLQRLIYLVPRSC